ncbi:MAG: hypothetical protein GY855_05690 [candidate division Zixibacteria bacterium]|nr:hypothetical protein [candidate division Zixibacteria bacterium]
MELKIKILGIVIIAVLISFSSLYSAEQGKDDTDKFGTGEDIVIYELSIENGNVRIVTAEGVELEFDLRLPEISIPEIPELEDLIIVSPIPGKSQLVIRHSKGEKFDEIVEIGEDVVIEEDEEVDGDILVLWADVAIKGYVNGNVTVMNGDIIVTSTGRVAGSVTSLGGMVEKEPGAVIGGDKVAAPISGFEKPGIEFSFPVVTLFILSILIAVGFNALIPQNIKKIQNSVETSFIKSLLFGYLFFFLLPFAFVLLLVTVIGIPIALIVLPIAVIAALALGLTAICNAAGAKFLSKINASEKPPFINVIIGVTLCEGILLIGKLLNVITGFIGSIGDICTIVGIVIFFFIVLPVSFGAAVINRFGIWPRKSTEIKIPIN